MLKSELAKAAGIKEDIKYEYKKMDDAPYELDLKELRHMQKMERALDEMLERLDDPELKPDDCAEAAGFRPSYFEREFKRYFGLPFGTYLMKLRLRQAAREILEGKYPGEAGREYGYSSAQSFSKGFRKEFGISPRIFQGGGYDVPDMPERKVIMGLELTQEYHEVNAMRVGGVALDPPRGSDTYLADNCSVVYPARADGTYVGTWWYDPEEGMKYIFGRIREQFDSVYHEPAHQPQRADEDVILQGGDYVIWSYERPENDDDIPKCSRIMWRYVIKEWVPLNRKIPNKLRCTYEVFTPERIYMYLPLQAGFLTTEKLLPHKWSIPAWARYIDDHITEKLSLESLAFKANYSTHNYRDIFCMYYGVTPSVYIRRRRITLAASEIEKAHSHQEMRDILKKYRFANYMMLEKASREEFGRNLSELIFDDPAGDLITSYESNKDNVHCSFGVYEGKTILAHSVEEIEKEAIPDETVERIVYWFRRDFQDLKGLKKYLAYPKEKVFIWGNDPVIHGIQRVYPYYIGSVVKKKIKEDDMTGLKENASLHLEHTEPGRYAVFSVYGDTDDSPADTFRFLTRVAFGGWINEHRWRLDLTRRTFVLWKKGKLFFFVPLVH